MVAREEEEIDLLKPFLPERLSESEVENMIEQVISQTQATSVRDMGKVMVALKSLLAGRADMSQVSRLVRGISTTDSVFCALHKKRYNNRMSKDVFGDFFALSGKKTAEAWGRFMDELSRNPDTWLSQIQGAQKKQMAVALNWERTGNRLSHRKRAIVVFPAKNGAIIRFFPF